MSDRLSPKSVTHEYVRNLERNVEGLAEALRKIAEREWASEEKTWRTEAIEMQDEAREALAQWEAAK
jgi:hypothetical protein